MTSIIILENDGRAREQCRTVLAAAQLKESGDYQFMGHGSEPERRLLLNEKLNHFSTVVVVTPIHGNALAAHGFAKEIKKQNPNIRIWFRGPLGGSPPDVYDSLHLSSSRNYDSELANKLKEFVSD